jgi:hypothetical protein
VDRGLAAGDRAAQPDYSVLLLIASFGALSGRAVKLLTRRSSR